MRRTALLAAVFLMSSRVLAASLEPGEYITERGWGVLKLERTVGGKVHFNLESVGGNAHTCSLEGEVRGGKATLDGVEEGKPCVIAFTAKAEGVDVMPQDGMACSYYCGARAYFQGVYLKPAPGCSIAESQQTQKTFKQLYDRHAYAEARATLEPTLTRCAATLGWLEEGWLRNDLAITYHKLGLDRFCLNVLEPLKEDAARSEQDLRDMYPPADADNYIPIAHAARTNLKLCRGKKR